jgi:flagellar hook protein FlgE
MIWFSPRMAATNRQEKNMPDFSIALSGLKAVSTSLNTIADNLSNMNTTAYKSQTTTFSTMLSQQVGTTGSGNAISVGSGVQVATNTTDFSSGTLSSADSTSDMAISGDGFFVLDNNGSYVYTRDGAFEVSSDGTLESSSGLAVVGYEATDGVVDTSALTDITIPTGTTMSASATTAISFTQNLNSSATVGTTVTGTQTIYDSLGNTYTATVTYEKTGTNEWSYSVSVPDTISGTSSTSGSDTTYTYNVGSSSDGTVDTVDTSTDLTLSGLDLSGNSVTITVPTITSGETLDEYATAVAAAMNDAGIEDSNVEVSGGTLKITGKGITTSGSLVASLTSSSSATGTLEFDSSGNLTSPTTSVTGITFSGLSDGAATLNLTWDLSDSSGTSLVTQTASDSTTTAETQDGYASGTYESFSVDSSGIITATFSNGETQTVGQIAVATIANEQGLSSVGSSNYATTSASGEASIGIAGTGGRGTIADEELEASNVDISAEFSDLIVAQRAFEANSKVITTFDTVVGQAINMIQ